MTPNIVEGHSANVIQRSTLVYGMLLTIVGWALGGAVGRYVSKGEISTVVVYPIGWAIGAGVTSVVLYGVCPYIGWKQSLVTIIGWLVSWPFGLATSGGMIAFAGAVILLASERRDWVALAITIGMTVGMVIAGTLAGLATEFVLHWASPSIRWKQTLVMAIGWSMAWATGGSISSFIEGSMVSPIGWAIAGAIGSSIMFWQIDRAAHSFEIPGAGLG